MCHAYRIPTPLAPEADTVPHADYHVDGEEARGGVDGGGRRGAAIAP